ncbi:DUF5808 domain-containing protein [Corynebacterium mendelii]|uniref:DUF5808 domain-containing protein n=1 Tax=Corynebacterium mendelii TaxID=2765362 RepID=A0A939E1A7_9CORY|nr:DUF5808 domain-containing protein [Corynebacterium mendelii]MBN9643637.1 hypothetical protein [Corynebacterium mendelii]
MTQTRAGRFSRWISNRPATGAQMKFFDPSDPALFVPRRFGSGFSLNTGAVAVKLGLVRPDDSLDDTAPYLDRRAVTILRWSPVVPLGIVAATAWRARADGLSAYPINWNWKTHPTRFAPAWIAFGIPCAIATIAAAQSLSAGRNNSGTSLPEPAAAGELTPDTTIDVATPAFCLGEAVTCAGIALATVSSARRPDEANPALVAAIAAGPVAATGAAVWAVRRALNSIAATLAHDRTSAF